MEKQNIILLLMYAVGFLDLLGVSMTVPLLSKHARDIGASPTAAGLIGSLYGFLQLFSCPLVGTWSDKFGRKPVLVYCLLLSALSYALLGLADSIILLIIARIPAGLFKHSQELSKSFLADVCPQSQHSRVFGRFNSISNIGFIVGPVVGGYVTDNVSSGFHCVALITATIFLLNCGLVYTLTLTTQLSDVHQQCNNVVPPVVNQQKLDHDKVAPPVVNYTAWLSVWNILLARFLLGAAVLVYRADFVVTVHRLYGASQTTIGYITSLSSIVGTLAGFTLGWISEYYCGNSWQIFLHAGLFQLVSLVGLVFVPNVLLLTVCHAALSVACSIGRVAAIDVTLVQGGGRHLIGTLMGAGSTVLSVARMLAPTVSGLSHELADYGPVLTSALLAAAGTVVLLMSPSTKLHTE
jgi:MFS family permease